MHSKFGATFLQLLRNREVALILLFRGGGDVGISHGSRCSQIRWATLGFAAQFFANIGCTANDVLGPDDIATGSVTADDSVVADGLPLLDLASSADAFDVAIAAIDDALQIVDIHKSEADTLDSVAPVDENETLPVDVGSGEVVGDTGIDEVKDAKIDSDTAPPIDSVCDGKSDANYDVVPQLPCPAGGCDDGNACTTDKCDAKVGCVHDGKYFEKTFLPADLYFDGDMVTTAEQGFAIAGTEATIAKPYVKPNLLVVDGNGNKIWQNVYESGAISAIAQLSDGYAVAGYQYFDQTNAWTAAWILRTNNVGDVVWSKTYGNFDKQSEARRIFPNGAGLVFAGVQDTDGLELHRKALLVSLDEKGNVLWEKSYFSDLWDITGLAKAGADFILSGWCEGTAIVDNWQATLIRTDLAGNLLWRHDYGDSYKTQQCNGIAVLPDGFVLIGSNDYATPKSEDVWLARTDAAGKLLWQRTYNIKNKDFGMSVVGLSDGFAFVATTNAAKSGAMAGDLTLVRVDLMGNFLWSENYGNKNGMNAAVALRALPGGFAISGRTAKCAPVPPLYDLNTLALLIRTDAYGHANCAESGACFAKTPADCDDKNPCTADLCDGKTGCGHVNLPDDATCALAKKCKLGKCS